MHDLLLVQSNQSNINYKSKTVYKSVYRENGRRQSITVVLESFPCYNHVKKKYIYIKHPSSTTGAVTSNEVLSPKFYCPWKPVSQNGIRTACVWAAVYKGNKFVPCTRLSINKMSTPHPRESLPVSQPCRTKTSLTHVHPIYRHIYIYIFFFVLGFCFFHFYLYFFRRNSKRFFLFPFNPLSVGYTRFRKQTRSCRATFRKMHTSQ